MDVLREYEIRLFDSDRKLVLVVPIIAASDELAQEQAATLSRREKATDFAIRPQMRSANYRNTNRDAAR